MNELANMDRVADIEQGVVQPEANPPPRLGVLLADAFFQLRREHPGM
jgi:hypothetical protein